MRRPVLQVPVVGGVIRIVPGRIIALIGGGLRKNLAEHLVEPRRIPTR